MVRLIGIRSPMPRRRVVRAQERIHTCHIQFQIFAEISLHIDTSTETFQIVRFHNRLMIVVIEGGVDLKPLATSIERNVVIMDQAGTAYFVKMIIRLGLLQLILIIQHSPTGSRSRCRTIRIIFIDIQPLLFHTQICHVHEILSIQHVEILIYALYRE